MDADDRYCPDDCPHLRPIGNRVNVCVWFDRLLRYEPAGEWRDLRCTECRANPPKEAPR